jgi:voltage-gated potassium channel Kch
LASITTVGYGDIVPHSDEERIVAMVALLVGTGFYSYVIGSISSIVASTDSTQRTYLEKMDLIYSYMKVSRRRHGSLVSWL